MKYLKDGQAVELIAEVPGGFLVSSIFDTEEVSGYVDDEPFFVRHIFDSLPTERHEIQIDTLSQQIDEKSARLREISNELRAAEKESAARMKALAGFKGLELLESFIAGKITHYVEVGYFDIVIKPFEQSKCECDKNELKLLTLFGRSNGDLAFRLNRYSDGSGGYTDVFPCIGYDAALHKASEAILTQANEGRISDALIKRAAEYGVSLPIDPLRAYYAAMRESSLSTINKLEDQITTIKERITKLPL